MTRFSFGVFGVLLRAAVLASAALVAGCGSGAVSAPPVTPTSAPISITPSTATLYSDTPSTFIITGGNGNYIVTSSDQSAISIAGLFTGGSQLTVVPNPVAADTQVTLTVRDTGIAAPVTAALTVKPKTVSNVISIIPSASQPASCGAALCAGGDAEVRVTLAQGGIPIVNRLVRFDVVSGDIRFITSAPGTAEAVSVSTTATTDSSGVAVVRVRALTDAPAQTAILQITDTSSGSTQRASVTISPSSSAALNAQPSTIVFKGIQPNTCASGISADVIVFGGRPPYLISQPGSFTVTPTVITNSGGRFSVTATGQCSSGSDIAVVDAAGATVTVRASNALSDVPATPVVPPFNVSPPSVELSSCTAVGNVTLTGGSGQYFASSGDTSTSATVSGNIGSIKRIAGSGTPGNTTFTVTFSDGSTSRPVEVKLSGAAAAGC